MAEPESKRLKSDQVTLYSYFRSTCSWRVRIALAIKSIDYTYQAVHLLKDGGEQLKPNFAGKNPMMQVPILEIDGVCLSQSVPIIEYLEETRQEPPLLPSDPIERARVRQIVEIINSGIQPIQNLSVLKKVTSIVPEEERDERKMEWGRFWIDRGFQALEKVLETTAGSCCFGDQVTLADILLVPQVYNANRFGVDMSAFPIISRLNEDLSSRPEFVAAHPNNQPDFPPET